ncbi:MAG: 50S ribosomal protein L30 [Armatimonadota bacterium]|nr:50S ribosomal protein L30 [Armatimonadota bacterium]
MLKITLKKSLIGFNGKQRKTVKALGLGKLDSWVLQADSPQIRGMIKKVTHLLQVEQLEEPVEGEVQ